MVLRLKPKHPKPWKRKAMQVEATLHERCWYRRRYPPLAMQEEVGLMDLKVQPKHLSAKERAAIALQVLKQHPVAFALFGTVHACGMAWGVFMAGRIAQWW